MSNVTVGTFPDTKASDDRDRAIAVFFQLATEVLRLCKPLVERAVKEELERKGRR